MFFFLNRRKQTTLSKLCQQTYCWSNIPQSNSETNWIQHICYARCYTFEYICYLSALWFSLRIKLILVRLERRNLIDQILSRSQQKKNGNEIESKCLRKKTKKSFYRSFARNLWYFFLPSLDEQGSAAITILSYYYMYKSGRPKPTSGKKSKEQILLWKQTWVCKFCKRKFCLPSQPIPQLWLQKWGRKIFKEFENLKQVTGLK